jgi:Ca2+-binding RTX toxin-like protein
MNSGAMTITGGTAGDTIAMENGADVLTGGTGTDTLVIAQNAVLGGFQIDLSASGDQVTTYNGSANSAVQSGFENVNLSGVTGTFGADITAIKTGSTIVGTANADQVTGGAGVDVITGGAGNDTLTGGSGADIFVITGGLTAFGLDVITDFTVGTDTLRVTGANIGNADTTLTLTTGTATSAAALNELVVATTALANDAAIVTAIQLAQNTTPALFVFFNTETASAELWYDAAANTDGGETKLVTLTGVANADLANITATNFVTLV